MRVSKSSDHWCALGTMSNFEKRNLRSGHLIRPGHVTFGVSGSSFFWKCVKLLAEQVWQIWRRYAPPFSRYLRKTLRGAEINPPPPVRGLTGAIINCKLREPVSLHCLQTNALNNNRPRLRVGCRVPKITSLWRKRTDSGGIRMLQLAIANSLNAAWSTQIKRV